MAKNKRIVWIDTVKCLCMFFIICSHIHNQSIAEEFRQFYIPFILTGFLFITGYTYTYRFGFKNHLIKKIKQLLIPWLLLSMINILLSNIMTFAPSKHFGLWQDIGKNLLQIRGYGDGLWFVNALFVAYIPFYFFIKKYEESTNKNKDKCFFLIGLLFYFIEELYISFMPADVFFWNSNRLPWHVEYVPFALFFMFCGYLAKKNFSNQMGKKINTTTLIIFSLFYLAYIFIPYGFGIKFSFIIQLIYKLVKYGLGLFFIISWSKSIKPTRLTSFIGQNTLLYFGLQGKFISVWELIIKKVIPVFSEQIYASSLLSTVYSLLFGIVCSILLVIPILIINKYFPILSGKHKC